MRNIKDLEDDMMKSVGVSQYGIESSLPKGNNISKVVENEAIRRVENTKVWAEMITDVKYIQARWHRITDEKEASILNMRLSGYEISEISQAMKMSRGHVYKVIREIAKAIKSYPQENDTNDTDLGN